MSCLLRILHEGCQTQMLTDETLPKNSNPNDSRAPNKPSTKKAKPAPNLLSQQTDWRVVPYWFAALAGLIYAAGFLVDFTFLSVLGIRETMAEAFKAKYVYVGLLCLQFPVSVAVVILGFARIMRSMKLDRIEGTKVGRFLPSMLLIMNLLFVFYLLIGFARSKMGTFYEHEGVFSLIFALTVIGLILARNLEDWIADKRKESRSQRIRWLLSIFGVWFWNAVRWLLFVLSSALTIIAFWHLWPMLWEMLRQGGYLYFGMIGLIITVLYRVDVNMSRYMRLGMKRTVILLAICICLAFAYLAILAFAARIYPYIPASRGGGDYTTEPPSVLTFDPRHSPNIPSQLLDRTTDQCRSNPLVILRETADTLFVAVPTKTNGPCQWRRLGRVSKPVELFALKREAVAVITFDNEPSKALSCEWSAIQDNVVEPLASPPVGSPCLTNANPPTP